MEPADSFTLTLRGYQKQALLSTRGPSVTEIRLLTDFLIRVNARRMPSLCTSTARHERYVLLPDGLEHPKYRNLRYREGRYFICRQEVLEQFASRGGTFFLGTELGLGS